MKLHYGTKKLRTTCITGDNRTCILQKRIEIKIFSDFDLNYKIIFVLQSNGNLKVTVYRIVFCEFLELLQTILHNTSVITGQI